MEINSISKVLIKINRPQFCCNNSFTTCFDFFEKKVCNSVTRIVRKTVHLAKFSPIISRFQESTNYRLDSKSVMYSKEMFLKSEKISKKIKKCNYWWHFCLVYLVYLC